MKKYVEVQNQISERLDAMVNNTKIMFEERIKDLSIDDFFKPVIKDQIKSTLKEMMKDE